MGYYVADRDMSGFNSWECPHCMGQINDFEEKGATNE